MDRRTVLVIESDQQTRRLILEQLAGAFKTIVAEHLADATRLLQAQPVDAVVLGLVKPLATGEEVVQQLSQYQIPLVVLTDLVRVYGPAALNAGAAIVLEKPKDLLQLPSTIQWLLEQ